MYDHEEENMFKALKSLKGTVKYLNEQYHNPISKKDEVIERLNDEIGLVEAWLQINKEGE